MGRDETQISLQGADPVSAWEDKMIPPSDGMVVCRPLSVQDVHDQEGMVLKDGCLRLNVPLVHGVAGAGDQTTPGVGGDLCHLAAPGGVPVGAADHVQALFQVKFPGLSVLEPAVVVEPVGDVAALLGLQDEGVSADGVDGARLDLEEISLLDGENADQIAPALLRRHAAQLFPVLGVVADDDGGVRVAVQDVPALRFAGGAVLVGSGVLLIRVNLDAQVIPGVDDLYQQGELAGAVGAEELGLVFPEPAQRFSSPRSLLDGAVPVAVGAHHPRLPGVVAGDVIAVFIPQAGAAPEHLLEYGLQKNDVSHKKSP